MPKRRKKKPESLFLFLFKKFKKKKRRTKKSDELPIEVKREISGILVILAGILILLSNFNHLGVPGEVLNRLLKPVLGLGVNILPILLGVTAMILFKNEDPKPTFHKITGIFLFFVSFLSLVHISLPMEQMYTEASNGNFGGFLGYIPNLLLGEMLGLTKVSNVIIYSTGILISMILSLDISIKTLFQNLYARTEVETKKTKSKTKEKESKKQSLDLFNDTQINIIKPEFKSQAIKNEKKPQPKKIPNEQVNQIDQNTLQEAITWEYPSVDLLENESSKIQIKDSELRKKADEIRRKLEQFDIKVGMQNVHVGPTVIQYTLKPDAGVKLSKITNLKNDIALALAAKSLRIEAPIPGKSLVGIEVPSEKRVTVKLKEIILSKDYQDINEKSKLVLPLGRDVSVSPVIADLHDMPHLLIAGATNSGKSVCINTFLLSLIMQNSPAELKMILVDPKQVELRDYNDIPHLLTPVIVDPNKAANALKWSVSEMNRRYAILSEAGCRNIKEYNSSRKEDEKQMPNILILIDELADLMMANGKEIEGYICRLAQMARAVGMHLILATQRPSVDVITGLIKANVPSRISFSVSSSIDSRTILDTVGAEDLLGKGDMLYLQKDYSKPRRIQGIYASPLEIKKVTNFLKMSDSPEYRDDITDKNAGINKSDNPSMAGISEDELYKDAYECILQHQKASASLLQRRLKVGYARAARLLDILEENGVVGPVNGAKPREIYIKE